MNYDQPEYHQSDAFFYSLKRALLVFVSTIILIVFACIILGKVYSTKQQKDLADLINYPVNHSEIRP